MLYRRYSPPPPLSSHIHCLWYSEGMQGAHPRERLLPNGESGIVIDLREQPIRIYDCDNPASFETHPPAVFCGARSDCFVIETSRQERVIGIQFKAGGAFPFLGMPASELANASHSLENIWGSEAALLREELLATSHVESMFVVLENALLERYRKMIGSSAFCWNSKSIRNSDGVLHPAVSFALRSLSSSHSIAIADLAERVGLSSRRFIEIFRIQTGLSPKAFQRVRRFQHVLCKLRHRSHHPLTELALDCGYYDQSHFIHDFRRFSGTTPSDYLKIATPHLNHLPIE